MIEIVVRVALALLLGGAAVAKLLSPRTSEAALATFGFAAGALRRGAWVALIVTELALAAGVALGSNAAAFGAAALMAMFAALMGHALMRGRAGAPCACFGARSTIGPLSVVAQPRARRRLRRRPVPPGRPTRAPTPGSRSGSRWRSPPAPAWRSLCSPWRARSGCCACSSGPRARSRSRARAPPSGRASPPWPAAWRFEGHAELGLAVFTSESCHLCQTLAPAIENVALRPARRRRSVRRGRRGRRCGGSWPCRAARSPSPPAATGRCSRRGPSTTSPSSRASSRPPRGGAARAPPKPPTRAWGAPDRCLSRFDQRLPRQRHVAARVPRARRRRPDRHHGRAHRRFARRPRRVRGLPLLRPHLHDRVVPSSDRAAAHRLAGLPASRQRRPADRRRRPAGQRRRTARSTRTASCCATPTACPFPRASDPRLRPGAVHLRHQDDGGRGLVPLLRRQGSEARRLLLQQLAQGQRRRLPDGLLLPRPQGLLRHVLRHAGPLLMGPLGARASRRRPS